MNYTRYEAVGNRTNHSKRGQYEAAHRNADQAEWSAALHGFAHVSAGTRDDMMSETALEFSGTEAHDSSFMGREVADEGLQASTLEVVAERQKLLGPRGYPFQLVSNSLEFKGDNKHPYLALLTLCHLPSVSARPYNTAPVAFEYLSLIAAQAYLGQRSSGWRFGWPRDNKAHLRVSEATRTLQGKAGGDIDAWQWNPVPSKPQNPNPRDLKDAGMDIVAWVPWHDKGPGNLHLVGQCACGEDWKWKQHDLELKALGQWMRLPEPAPIRAIFTPRHLSLPAIRDTAPQAGLVFDRIRMTDEICRCPTAVRRAGRFAQRIVELGKRPY